MTRLPLDDAIVLQAMSLKLDHEPVAPDQIISGTPTTGIQALTEFDDLEVGVWEITPGVVSDVEVDEVFIVLSGHATLRRGDGSESELVAGCVGRLDDGEETEWEVHETLRKIYLA